MFLKVSELKKGDDVMYASGSKFRRVKLLKTPEKRLNSVASYNAYKVTQCTERVEERTKKKKQIGASISTKYIVLPLLRSIIVKYM